MQGSPTFLTGPTGLAILATATPAEALAAIGAMANTAPEIITNANGRAYRWPNGLQICATTINLNYVDPGLLSATWTYPAAFTTGSVPHCFLSPPATGQGGSINGPLWNTTDFRKVAVFGANQPNNPHLSAILRIWSIAGQTFSTEYISCQAVAIGTYTP